MDEEDTPPIPWRIRFPGELRKKQFKERKETTASPKEEEEGTIRREKSLPPEKPEGIVSFKSITDEVNTILDALEADQPSSPFSGQRHTLSYDQSLVLKLRDKYGDSWEKSAKRLEYIVEQLVKKGTVNAKMTPSNLFTVVSGMIGMGIGDGFIYREQGSDYSGPGIR